MVKVAVWRRQNQAKCPVDNDPSHAHNRENLISQHLAILEVTLQIRAFCHLMIIIKNLADFCHPIKLSFLQLAEVAYCKENNLQTINFNIYSLTELIE